MIDPQNAIKQLQDELNQTNQLIENTNKTIAHSQSDLKRLTAHKSALQRLVDELDANKTAAQKQREVAQKVGEDAQKAYEALVARLDKDLTDAQRAAIDAAISEANEEIKKLGAARTTAYEAADKAARASAEAKQDLAIGEKALSDLQAGLQSLPAKVQAAQGQVATLSTSAQAAADAGRLAEAYFLAGELRKALEDLRNVSDPEKETALQSQVADMWERLSAATEEAATKAETWAQAQQALTKADQEWQSKKQARAASVKAKLAELEKEWAKAPAKANGQAAYQQAAVEVGA
jgi:DNA repair exonuclease SbcCD ATPase subunit